MAMTKIADMPIAYPLRYATIALGRARQPARLGTHSLLDAGEGLADQRPDRAQVVAPLLDHDGRQAESAERAASGAESIGRDPQGALGIAGGGVDAERHHQNLRPAFASPCDKGADRLQPLLVGRARRQGEIAIGAATRAGARLGGEA